MRRFDLSSFKNATLPERISMYVAIITSITSGKNMPSAEPE